MADDNEVQIRFTASTDPAEEGIANVHKALDGLKQSMNDVSGAATGLRNAFTAALPTDKLADAGKAMAGVGDATANAASQLKAMGNAIKAADAAFNSTRQHLAAELKLHEITVDQETAQLVAAIQKRDTAEQASYASEIASLQASGKNWEAMEQKKVAAHDKAMMQISLATDTALKKDAAGWQSTMSPVLSAWNSQLRGLLGGTESWSKAMKKIVGDLVIQIIEYFERLAVQKAALGFADKFKGTALAGGPQSFIQSLFGGGGRGDGGGQAAAQVDPALAASMNALNVTVGGQAAATGANTAATLTGTAAATAGATATGANTAATVTGTVAASAGATVTTANTGGLLANTGGLLAHLGAVAANTVAIIPNTLATILNTAAEGLQSLFPYAQGAWEVPATMPALVHKGEMIVPAEGGHAAAMRTLLGGLSTPKFDLGTDMVLRGGLAVVHPGESVVPAARGSGPFTGGGFGGNTTHINPSINITAMDSRSVSRFFNDNAHHMVRALQRGLKGGAHLPLRSSMR
jgi:hypothetical protein